MAPLALLPAGLAASIFTFGGILALVGACPSASVTRAATSSRSCPRSRTRRCAGDARHLPRAASRARLALPRPRGRGRPVRGGHGGAEALPLAGDGLARPYRTAARDGRRNRARLVLALGSWAAIGFAGLRDYPALLEKLDGIAASESYSVFALGQARLSETAARRRDRRVRRAAPARSPRCSRGGRRRALAALALAAGAALSPIVWLHYLVLLYVPIALARPRLCGLWLLPLALSPFSGSAVRRLPRATSRNCSSWRRLLRRS